MKMDKSPSDCLKRLISRNSLLNLVAAHTYVTYCPSEHLWSLSFQNLRLCHSHSAAHLVVDGALPGSHGDTAHRAVGRWPGHGQAFKQPGQGRAKCDFGLFQPGRGSSRCGCRDQGHRSEDGTHRGAAPSARNPDSICCAEGKIKALWNCAGARDTVVRV